MQTTQTFDEMKGNQAISPSKVSILHKDDHTRESQRAIAEKFADKPLVLKDKWYLLNKQWYDHWTTYIHLDHAAKKNAQSEVPPDKISNKVRHYSYYYHIRTKP